MAATDYEVGTEKPMQTIQQLLVLFLVLTVHLYIMTVSKGY